MVPRLQWGAGGGDWLWGGRGRWHVVLGAVRHPGHPGAIGVHLGCAIPTDLVLNVLLQVVGVWGSVGSRTSTTTTGSRLI